MKIIDRHKDYYDYLQGVYGVDTQAVFDRRGSVVLDAEFWKERLGDTYVEPTWRLDDVNRAFYILECGFVQYLFRLELSRDRRWKQELVHTFRDHQHYRKQPMTIYYVRMHTRIFNNEPDYTNIKNLQLMQRWRNINMENSDIELPILRNTNIPAFIPPEEIWKNLYDYLLKMNEPKVTDTRNDVQKLEGKGFDKVTSFRHPVR